MPGWAIDAAKQPKVLCNLRLKIIEDLVPDSSKTLNKADSQERPPLNPC